MEFRILGPLEVLSDGRALDLGGRNQRALLALLLLKANRVVASDRLIDALWDEQPPETARKALQVYVSHLRKLLGRERVQTVAPGYVLRVGDGELDAGRCLAFQQAGRLDDALALWRGPALGDLAAERFARPEIARLEELRLSCLEERGEQELARGRHAELAGSLESLIAEHPLRERLREQLMLSLYRSGRQADALEAYQAARAALVDELGIEPARRLRELHQAILQQDPALDLAPSAVARGATFVGRERELTQLLGGLDDAFAGRGRLFLVIGEPGIGKSRLAEEVIAHAKAGGAEVLVGRCWEAGGAPAYWPWVQAFRDHVRETGAAELRAHLGAGAAALAQIVPEVRDRFPDLPEPPALEPEGVRFRLFDATAEFLRNASRDRPVVLVLDDLHAADAPSLLLLQFLARQLAAARLLVIGAFRDVDPLPGRPLTEMLAEVAREPSTRRLALAGLSEGELAELVELTGGVPASPGLVKAVREETEGNPLFAGEIIRLLSVEGAGTTGRLAIPQTVRDVIARRLTHLSPECNRVLVLASVLGREFALSALASIGDAGEDELLDLLDEAMAARVVSDVPGAHDRLRFAHVLIRDTLYESLTTVRRAQLHRLVAGALEALYAAEEGPHLAELAHHCIAGGDFPRGVAYARRAGDRAVALVAYEEAARLYETALGALDPGDEPARCAVLLGLVDAQTCAGNPAPARQASLDAADIARRHGLPRELALAAAGYGGRIVWARAGSDARLIPLLEEGLAALGDADVGLRVRLLARLAGALRDERSRERRDAVSRQAVELARGTGEPAALAFALDGRAAAILAPDTLDECVAIAGELIEVAGRCGDTERVLAGHFHRSSAQIQLGGLQEAEADLMVATRIVEELRQPVQVWQVWTEWTMLDLAAGRLAGADKRLREASAPGERALPEAAVPVHRLQRYTLCDFRGGLDEVEPDIRDLVASYPQRTVFRCVLAHLHARLGRAPESRRLLDEIAPDRFAALPFDQEWLFAMSFLAEASALSAGHRAAVLYELLAPWAAHNAADQGEGIRGSVARYAGLLAASMERWDEAAEHFEAALAANARMGTRPWLARTQEDYAAILGERDPVRAQELFDAACATYDELGVARGRRWQRSHA